MIGFVSVYERELVVDRSIMMEFSIRFDIGMNFNCILSVLIKIIYDFQHYYQVIQFKYICKLNKFRLKLLRFYNVEMSQNLSKKKCKLFLII